MENKITWAGFWGGFLAVIVWLWIGLSKMIVWLWKAGWDNVRFPKAVVALFLSTLLGFFIGRHFPIQNLESGLVAPAIMPSVVLPSTNRQPKRVVDTSQADKAKADEARLKAEADKVKAEEARLKAEADRVKAEEARQKAEADKAIAEEARQKAEVGLNTNTKRETLTVKSRRAIIVYNMDPKHPLSLRRVKDGVDDSAAIICLPVKIQPMYFVNTSYVLRATMLESGVDVVETFIGDEGPWVWIYENGKMTVSKDLNILPVPWVYAKDVQP